MRLEGWNHIPLGYVASFELDTAPRWLRVWFHIPFLDRFAYPIAVRRGFGVLDPDPGWSPGEREHVPEGWRLSGRRG
jgi:hypothetical protein